MEDGYSLSNVGWALELRAREHVAWLMNRERSEGGVGVCVFSTKSVDLELALIDHILFPFSVALPPAFPPPAHPPRQSRPFTCVHQPRMLGAHALSTAGPQSANVINA